MSPQTLGVNISNDPKDADRDCALAAEMGFPWVRVSQEMPWYQQGLPALRTIVAAATEHGLKVHQCAQGMPANLAKGGRAGHFAAKDEQSAAAWGLWFAQCCQIVAPNGGQTGGAVSCTNEPDGFGWDTTPDAAGLAQLHKWALASRDLYAPGVPFITGEMSPSSNPDPLAFLKAIVMLCPEIMTDDHVWIGWHPYTDPRYPADVDQPWNTNHKMRAVQAYCSDQGKPNKKIMAGEWGLADNPASWAQRLAPGPLATYIENQYLPSFDSMASDGVHFAALEWFTLRDGYGTDGSWTDHCGLYKKNGRPKPVASVLRDYMAG
jgi:hypothetical protein